MAEQALGVELGLMRLAVSGFKSLSAEQAIAVKPLTILAGANSSGKSSIMQPLLLMKQTLEAPYDPGVFKLDGPNVQFSRYEDFLSRQSFGGAGFAVSLGLLHDLGKFSATFSYWLQDESNLSLKHLVLERARQTVTLAAGAVEPSALLGEFIPAPMPQKALQPGLTLKPERFYLQAVQENAETEAPLSMPLLRAFLGVVLRIIHVPGLRGNPQRAYVAAPFKEFFPGLFTNYVAGAVRHWHHNDPERYARLNAALEALGLTSLVRPRTVDDTRVELMLTRTAAAQGESDLVNIADVGFGVSQALPVVVALIAARPGDLVYIEQPEIHLHPKALMAMAGLLVQAAKRGVRLVVETHSDIILRGIQTRVALGELAPDKVSLNWFARNPLDGATTVRAAQLDENGAYGDWPTDFDDTALQVEKAYLDAVNRRLYPDGA